MLAKFEEAKGKVELDRSISILDPLVRENGQTKSTCKSISYAPVGQQLATPEVGISLMGTLGIRKEQVCSKGVREIRTVIASSSGICSASLQIVFCFLMVLSGPCGCANAPHAAVRAKFQGEFLDSSVDLGVDRLALLRSWVPGLIAINGVTSQPVFFRCRARGSCASVVPQSCLSQQCLLDLSRCTSFGSQWISV